MFLYSTCYLSCPILLLLPSLRRTHPVMFCWKSRFIPKTKHWSANIKMRLVYIIAKCYSNVPTRGLTFSYPRISHSTHVSIPIWLIWRFLSRCTHTVLRPTHTTNAVGSVHILVLVFRKHRSCWRIMWVLLIRDTEARFVVRSECYPPLRMQITNHTSLKNISACCKFVIPRYVQFTFNSPRLENCRLVRAVQVVSGLLVYNYLDK
jgi:hypothetical protein